MVCKIVLLLSSDHDFAVLAGNIGFFAIAEGLSKEARVPLQRRAGSSPFGRAVQPVVFLLLETRLASVVP